MIWPFRDSKRKIEVDVEFGEAKKALDDTRRNAHKVLRQGLEIQRIHLSFMDMKNNPDLRIVKEC
jgi:hypothetical protein